MSVDEKAFKKSGGGFYNNPIEVACKVIKAEGSNDDDWIPGVSSIECYLQNSNVTIAGDNSTDSPITWQANPEDSDEIFIKIRFWKHDFGQDVVSGLQRARITAVDPSHPDGQLLTHRDGEDNKLNILFID